MNRILIIAFAFALIGCGGRVEKDDRPVFHVDPTQPFRIEFGRGSGWNGLDTIKIDQVGRVELCRMKSQIRGNINFLSWESATLQLPPKALTEVLKAVEANGLMELQRAYHDPNVQDGTQWVLWIKQGQREKSVYFNNSFPWRITAFADQLDAILSAAGLGQLTWQPVPENESRQHERELWDSVK